MHRLQVGVKVMVNIMPSLMHLQNSIFCEKCSFSKFTGAKHEKMTYSIDTVQELKLEKDINYYLTINRIF